jgi:hypothetical protein
LVSFIKVEADWNVLICKNSLSIKFWTTFSRRCTNLLKIHLIFIYIIKINRYIKVTFLIIKQIN